MRYHRVSTPCQQCECFQKTGSFKIRGAMNAVKKLDADKKTKGVATHSSGNFGQALAYAAQTEGVPAYIVMVRGNQLHQIVGLTLVLGSLMS